jgi:thiamine biosynthesis protein ThiS
VSEDRIGIEVNGERRQTVSGQNLEELLRALDLHPRMVVVERNGNIVRRDAYPATPIEPGDRLELVHFVGGG